jgi:hypothetical protein
MKYFSVECQYNPLVNQIENKYAVLIPVMTAVTSCCVTDCYGIHAELCGLFDSSFVFRANQALNSSGCGMYYVLNSTQVPTEIFL